ncbi:DMT family transporter [Xenorhabdus sp. DI]|uniref:DMT family transporter n=1 Tax=Xenorhabdus doucetiae TaxID=351671 RepID=UPI00199512FB|nr:MULTISPECIES: DMT family transporter [unclassified Xenorhabdus]MBD2784935.1 DMT family transporter [Xenorhabdus sp. 3]MBD2789216.1 DMT family transporter [Xenorhabdus sp. DI]
MTFPISISTAILVCGAIFAGAVVPLQAGANAALGRSLGHPLWGTVVSLLVSLLAIIPVLLTMRVPTPQITQVINLPMWSWLGGIAGVIYITAAIILTPQLGATNFIICVITGQIIVSALVDHFGLMGLPIKEVNFGRIFGIVLIFSGVFIVQHFTTNADKF